MLITWFLFPELVLELKVNLFSLTLCVLLPGGETVSQHSTIKEKKIRRWNISKRLQTTEGNQVLSPIRTGHDGKRLLNDTGSLQKIQFEHLSCPSLSFSCFWFMNECCPVGFKEKKEFVVWIAQALDCVGFIHFYFNIILFFLYPGLSLMKSILKEA